MQVNDWLVNDRLNFQTILPDITT